MSNSNFPNILILMSDEHRADVVGYAGNDVVNTPTLDKLAQTGVSFHQAYTPSPVCIPARQCITSGQLPKTCGCEGWYDLQPNYLTLPRYFAQYGYMTVVCGKLQHFDGDPLQGWEKHFGRSAKQAHRFATIADHFQNKVAESMLEERSEVQQIKRAGRGISTNALGDTQTTAKAIAFIKDYFALRSPTTDIRSPLLLKVSFEQPHYPYLTGANKLEYYFDRVRPYQDLPISLHPFLSQRLIIPGIDVTSKEIRQAVAAYYGMVETMDTACGTILAALEAVGQDISCWIIVYISDHGEMLGEHVIWEKEQFYEGSVRVPMIIRATKYHEPGTAVNKNVNLCDLFATLCDLAGLPIPPNLDSRSMRSLMQQSSSYWNNEAISQIGSTNVMIKRDCLKYQYYGPNMPEVLFDLGADTSEITNYIDDLNYSETIIAFRKRLAELGHGPNAIQGYQNAGYCFANTP